jgi:hypothetical protein
MFIIEMKKTILIDLAIALIVFQFLAGVFSTNPGYYMPATGVNSSPRNPLTIQSTGNTQTNNSGHYYDHVTRDSQGNTTSSNQGTSPGCGCPIKVTLQGAMSLGNGGQLQWGVAFQNGQPVAQVNVTLPLGGGSSGSSRNSGSSR